MVLCSLLLLIIHYPSACVVLGLGLIIIIYTLESELLYPLCLIKPPKLYPISEAIYPINAMLAYAQFISEEAGK